MRNIGEYLSIRFKMIKSHTFHIPVMGIGYTIDTPVKVSHLGISSVISLVDDMLIEKMREFHSRKRNIPFEGISTKIENFRAKRITAYLNMVDDIVNQKFSLLKQSFREKAEDFEKYIASLPNYEHLKTEFKKLKTDSEISRFFDRMRESMKLGSIDVNIMTKLDKENYQDGTKLPIEYNDAHAALRGFAESKLKSSVVLSAGINPALYSYIEQFDDFYPNETGHIKKNIILKVSDYKSALIQGKFLAKKGLWVSEFRVESGLNCGGHAFATEGFLMGPILEDFKQNRENLSKSIFELYAPALDAKKKQIPAQMPNIKITAQGGIGTAQEHDFMMDYYGLDAVGWGSPFLLVPEIIDVDTDTLELLKKAKEDDLYLSNISPLGVPFNNLRGNSEDEIKNLRIASGKPGAVCKKQYLKLNSEYPEATLCMGSNTYQQKKIKELSAENLSKSEYNKKFKAITDRSCLCVGLGTASLLTNDLDTSFEGNGVSVCPGPNLAYFSDEYSLNQMIGHIYGRLNIIKRKDRPNVFLKEIELYISYLKSKISEFGYNIPEKQIKQFQTFKNNLNAGISYYADLFSKYKSKISDDRGSFSKELQKLKTDLEFVSVENPKHKESTTI